ncbi:beta-galactosidase [Candidatus Daviesbacteria bacterium]|nr:beta-galactosidase [Candidatus Daviesbacteria bacterium]
MIIHRAHLPHILILISSIIIILILIYKNSLFEADSLKGRVLWGVSYSPEYAKSLGLDPRQTYQQILTDLKTKNIRLSAYWNQIEPEEDQFNYSDLDYYLDQAKKNQAKVILAVGYKLPRWPECRAPKWLNNSSTQILRQRQLEMVTAVVKHYDNHPEIQAWQIENEPLLPFGDCPPPDRDFLTREVQVVREITHKPIIVTDSGELRAWRTPMMVSDIFGTTMYRIVSNNILGTIHYPFQPWFYRIKSDLVRKFFAPHNQKTIIVELQAEAWSDKFLTEIPIEEQVQIFPASELLNYSWYAKKTGFDEIFLWGVEWWYYLAQRNHPEYLQTAKMIVNDIK